MSGQAEEQDNVQAVVDAIVDAAVQGDQHRIHAMAREIAHVSQAEAWGGAAGDLEFTHGLLGCGPVISDLAEWDEYAVDSWAEGNLDEDRLVELRSGAMPTDDELSAYQRAVLESRLEAGMEVEPWWGINPLTDTAARTAWLLTLDSFSIGSMWVVGAYPSYAEARTTLRRISYTEIGDLNGPPPSDREWGPEVGVW